MAALDISEVKKRVRLVVKDEKKSAKCVVCRPIGFENGYARYVTYDLADAFMLEQYNWILSNGGYVTTIINGSIQSMHRLLMKHELTKTKNIVDHKDTDRCNNSRRNLRVCTASQNMSGTSALKHNKLGVKNISVDKNGKFLVQMTCGDEEPRRNRFDTLEEAEKVAVEWMEELQGEFAYNKRKPPRVFDPYPQPHLPGKLLIGWKMEQEVWFLYDEKYEELVRSRPWVLKESYHVVEKKGREEEPAKSFHRIIMDGETEKPFIDHINGNPSDNRRSNLRGATARENRMNTALGSNNKTGHNGVIHLPNGTWSSKLKLTKVKDDDKEPTPMTFLTFEAACLHSVELRRKYHGEFYRKQFDDDELVRNREQILQKEDQKQLERFLTKRRSTCKTDREGIFPQPNGRIKATYSRLVRMFSTEAEAIDWRVRMWRESRINQGLVYHL